MWTFSSHACFYAKSSRITFLRAAPIKCALTFGGERVWAWNRLNANQRAESCITTVNKSVCHCAAWDFPFFIMNDSIKLLRRPPGLCELCLFRCAHAWTFRSKSSLTPGCTWEKRLILNNKTSFDATPRFCQSHGQIINFIVSMVRISVWWMLFII